MLAHAGAGEGGVLVVDSDLPIGKGMASSSADLVATARAVGRALGLSTAPEAIEGWLRPIEPTDGVMHHGIAVFEHRAVRLRALLGDLPATTVVAVDEGGLLDTVAYNRRPKSFTDADRAEYAAMLAAMTEAVHAGDLPAVGALATRSAVLNQRLAPKANLEALARLAADVQALGVVCAHSGTMLGVLLDDHDPAYHRKLAHTRAACAALPGTVTVFRALTFPTPERAHAA
jgi:L-threonine kinase